MRATKKAANDLCPACGKPLPAEGALRKDRQTRKIVSIHFECARDTRRFSKDLFS